MKRAIFSVGATVRCNPWIRDWYEKGGVAHNALVEFDRDEKLLTSLLNTQFEETISVNLSNGALESKSELPLLTLGGTVSFLTHERIFCIRKLIVL